MNFRTLIWSILFLMGPWPAVAKDKPDCTLEPGEGSRKAWLSNGVDVKMAWSACNSMATEIVFRWSLEQGFPETSTIALRRASELVTEFERVTKEKVCPFTGDLPTALRKRSDLNIPYNFHDDIPVSDVGVAGWDGARVNVSSTTKEVELTVHYWANP